MTSSVQRAIGRCVLSALVSAVLAGCGSNNPGPVPDAANASDVYFAQDAAKVPDSAIDHSIALDTISSDTALPPDIAASDVPLPGI